MTKDLSKRFRQLFPKVAFPDFDRQFEDMMNIFSVNISDVKYIDEEDRLHLVIEAPGFNKDNIVIEESDGILKIKGQWKLSKGDRVITEKTLSREYTIGSIENINAKLVDGVLSIIVTPRRTFPASRKVDVR